MLGREAYDNPFILTNVDSHIFSETVVLCLEAIY